MKRKAILTTALALLLCSCNNELIALKDCPHEMEGIKVEISQSDEFAQKISISKDGRFLQELVGEDDNAFYTGSPEVFDNSIVFFVDANYDGDTDIFIGSGNDRTSNTILLWNSNLNKFERYGQLSSPYFQNPIFSPTENAIYESGSNSAFDGVYVKSVWDKGKLKETERIVEIYDTKDIDEYNTYSELKVSKKYTLVGMNNKKLAETDGLDELPNNWNAIISKLKTIWGVSDDTYSDDLSDNSQDEQSKQAELEDNIKKQVYEMLNEDNGWKIVDSPNSINDLKKGDDGKYTARFTDYGEYEHITYDLFIDVDNDGNVQSIRTKMYRITPTDKKPDGTADPNEIVRRRIQGLQY